MEMQLKEHIIKKKWTEFELVDKFISCLANNSQSKSIIGKRIFDGLLFVI